MGRGQNARGETRIARIETANGYQLTVDSALTMVERLLSKLPRRRRLLHAVNAIWLASGGSPPGIGQDRDSGWSIRRVGFTGRRQSLI